MTNIEQLKEGTVLCDTLDNQTYVCKEDAVEGLRTILMTQVSCRLPFPPINSMLVTDVLNEFELVEGDEK